MMDVEEGKLPVMIGSWGKGGENQKFVAVGGDSVRTLILYYSYETVIAIMTHPEGLLVSNKKWSTTTNKHKDDLALDKATYLDQDEFVKAVEKILQRELSYVAAKTTPN